ncbi:ROK family protein, partial [Streptococcus danieliae]|nr:ROK family protein [Streptococcus danieliae]
MEKKIIGIDLGGTSIKFAILTQAGEIQEKWSIKTNILDEGSHIVPEMIASIQHHLDLLNLTAENFLGIGMGSPGVVDRQAGTVVGAYNLNWKTPQLVKEQMEVALGIPFYIDNDANVAALGERWVGAG